MEDKNIFNLSKKERKRMLISFVIFIIISIIAVYQFIKKSNLEYEQRRKEYPFVTTDMFFSCIVELSGCFKGVSLLNSNNGKFTLPNSRNYKYSEYSLCSFLLEGDSLLKAKDSDTLYIFRNQKEYFFVLGEFIEETQKEE